MQALDFGATARQITVLFQSDKPQLMHFVRVFKKVLKYAKFICSNH